MITEIPIRRSGFKGLKHPGKHSLDLEEFGFGFPMQGRVDHPQVSCEEQKVLELASRAHRYMQELPQFRAALASTSFRNVRWNGRCCPADLTGDPVPFIQGQLAGDFIDVKNELMAATPHIQFPNVLHGYSLSIDGLCSYIYLKLNTYNLEMSTRNSYAH